MADFAIQDLGWVDGPRSNHGTFGTKVLVGMTDSAGLLEVVDAKPAMEPTPVGVPNWDWVDLPDVQVTQPKFTNHQFDTVIEVDPTCALMIGWVVQVQAGLGTVGTHHLATVQRWQHLMWAIDALGAPGVPVQLGYRIDRNWESESEPDYQDVEDHDLVWPAHFGIPMGSRQVRLPGDSDLVVAVGTDLSLSFPAGPIPPGYTGLDLGSALGDPNTANGVMAYFNTADSVPGQLRDAAGTVAPFSTPGVPLCQPVDLGSTYGWAWLADTGVLTLCNYTLGGPTTTSVLELAGFVPGDRKYTYTLSRLTQAAGTLFAVLRTHHDSAADHLSWTAELALCTFVGPAALTDWTLIRKRVDHDVFPA